MQLAVKEVAAPATVPPIVIIGTGPVGMRAARELLDTAPTQPLVIYGNEPWEPYDRVRLSGLLAGDTSWASLLTPLRIPPGARVEQRHNCAVVAIDREARTVLDETGRVQTYARLILALGSQPHVPDIPGVRLPGVFVFRNMSDAQGLVARRVRSRRTVILGGGLLGLETARAMQRANTQVVVVQHSTRLMNRQLDEAASAHLRRHIEAMGIEVVLGDSVKAIEGEREVRGVSLRSGQTILCDSVVLATGIRPNIELARDADLSVGRGVRVDNHLRTSDPNVYAVGECAEHGGRVYGLVAPGLDQAAVAARVMTGQEAQYRGSVAVASLKVVGLPVFSVGKVGEEEDSPAYRYDRFERAPNQYRSLVVDHGRLVGAVGLGDWPESGRIQEAVLARRRLWWWQRWRFRRVGRIWGDDAGVAAWPATAMVCNCTGTSRGALTQAISAGCTSVDALSQCTRAGTVCGTCKPRLAELLGAQVSAQPARGARLLILSALPALILAVLFLLLPPLPFASSVQGAHIDVLWRDPMLKQVTGFTLLGLALLAGALSARKRLRRVTLGSFAGWRSVHAIIGLVALLALLAHTGFRLGQQLDAMLIASFLGLTASGAFAAVAVAMETRLGGRLGLRLRSVWTYVHLLIVWPLPVLLLFHILKIYYF